MRDLPASWVHRLSTTNHSAAAGTVPGVACPIKLVGEELPPPTAPPLLGAHTESVLRDVLGLPDGEIRALREAHVIG